VQQDIGAARIVENEPEPANGVEPFDRSSDVHNAVRRVHDTHPSLCASFGFIVLHGVARCCKRAE
jgi:hypothetical protein